jgi:hypothetical protein
MDSFKADTPARSFSVRVMAAMSQAKALCHFLLDTGFLRVSMAAMNGICKLCGKKDLLKESHIIPDFYIRGLEHKLPTGSQGILQPFSMLLSTETEMEGGAKQRGYWEKIVGMKEYLLCGICEGKFSTNETYVRDFFYGNSSPLKKIPVGNLMRLRQGNDVLNLRKVLVSYKQLKLFQMSILWRAGVAKGSFFKNVNLGDFHESKIRALLLSENPGSPTDYPCLMVDLHYSEKNFEDWIEQPSKSKKEGQRKYRFVMGGYLYLFAVSKQKPRLSLQELCVKSNGEIIIPVEEERRILRGWATALRKAGRL